MGNHTALWEVRRDCRGLNKNSMGATWLKRNRKQQEIKHPLSPQPFSAWHLLAEKKASPWNHIYRSSNTFEAGDYSSNHEVYQAELQEPLNRQTLPSSEKGKVHIVRSTKKGHIRNKRKNKRKIEYFILHRISSIGAACLAVVITPSCHGTLASLLKW